MKIISGKGRLEIPLCLMAVPETGKATADDEIKYRGSFNRRNPPPFAV